MGHIAMTILGMIILCPLAIQPADEFAAVYMYRLPRNETRATQRKLLRIRFQPLVLIDN
jgi:hypothetical protein